MLTVLSDGYRRFVIGTLERTDQGFAFEYDDAKVVLAKQAGFFKHPALPQEKRIESRYLYGLFAERVPSPRRPDFVEMMTSWGVEKPDDQMEVLARSGGVSMTDRLELAEYRDDDDPLTTPLEFRIAGQRLRGEVPAVVQPGEELQLTLEPTNEADGDATMVARLGGAVVGYVPRQYAPLIAGHLRAGHLLHTIAVRRLLLPEQLGRWVVRTVRVDGSPA